MPERLFRAQTDISEFAAALPTRALGRAIEYAARTQSTNDLALSAARAGAVHGKLFIADQQDAGRGRRGRSWESPPGSSLLFSVVLRPAYIPPPQLGWIPLTAGLAVVEAIERIAGVHCTLKWPNDIVLPAAAAPGWEKLGGILCESVLPNASDSGFVVAGIGLNVNQRIAELPTGMKAPPTSVRCQCDAPADRLQLLREFLIRFEGHLDALARERSREVVLLTIQERLHAWWTERKRLRVQVGENTAEVVGAFVGLDAFGRLMLRDANSREHVFADAEIIAVEERA